MHVVDGSLHSVEVVAVKLCVMQRRTMQQAPQDYKRLSTAHFSECPRRELRCLVAILLGLTNVKAKWDLSKLKPVKLPRSLISSVPIFECNAWSWGIRR
jgi:hypothetical protein